MFTKSLVSQALIDATKAIMEEDEKKKMLLEPELDETGFHKAAHAARKAGQSHFEFQGKKYPVTSQPHSEGMEPPEKIGGQVLKKHVKKHDDKAAAKGHSAVVRPVEEDDKKDSPFNWKGKPSQLPKKPGELTGHEHKKTSTGDVYTKKYKKDPEDMKEESHPDEKEDKALVKKMVKPSALKKEEEKETHLSKHSMTNEKYVTPPEARKIADQEVHKHEKNMHKGKKETKLGEEEERHMTDAEMKKREHIVKSMKKGMKGFKDRYGDRAKNVMYATATKQAMKEEVEDLFEDVEYKKSHGMHDHPDTIQVLHAYHKGKKMGHIEEYHHMDATGKHTGKTRWAAHHYHSGDETVGHRTAEEASGHLMGCHDKHCKMMKEMGYHKEEYYAEDIGGISTISEKKKKVEMKEDEHVRVDGETDMNTKTVDGLRGRMKVPASYHNKTKSYKVGLTVGEEVEIEEDMKGTLKKIGSKVLDKLGHGSDADMIKDLAKKTGVKDVNVKPMKKESVDATDYNPKSQGGTRKELLSKYSKSGDPKHAEAARKAGATQSELKAARGLDSMFGHRGGVDKLAIKKEEVEVDETFKGPEAGSGTGDHPFVTNENSPMKLVKDLAKKSYKKIKQETMMGKIAGGI